MNSGKSTALLQAAYNYEERGSKVLIAKPSIDRKAGARVSSRLGVERLVDLLLSPEDNLREEFLKHSDGIACLLIDEAQFLTREQVEQALAIAVLDNVPVLAYGIRTDFRTAGFPGSTRLLEIAHSLEELKTMFNARKGANGFIFDGEQVAIDSIDTTYESLCANCYLEERAKA
jgi:thymidine kinase